MSSVNKVILIGHLGKDPETRYMPNGDAVTNLTLATSETWKDKNSGEKKEATEWHRVTLYRKLAEVAGQYLKKGSLAYFEGKLQTRKWQDKDGIDRYTTEVIADKLQLLGGKRDRDDSDDGDGGSYDEPVPQKRTPSAPSFADMDDDIPFANPYRGKYSLIA